MRKIKELEIKIQKLNKLMGIKDWEECMEYMGDGIKEKTFYPIFDDNFISTRKMLSLLIEKLGLEISKTKQENVKWKIKEKEDELKDWSYDPAIKEKEVKEEENIQPFDIVALCMKLEESLKKKTEQEEETKEKEKIDLEDLDNKIDKILKDIEEKDKADRNIEEIKKERNIPVKTMTVSENGNVNITENKFLTEEEKEKIENLNDEIFKDLGKAMVALKQKKTKEKTEETKKEKKQKFKK